MVGLAWALPCEIVFILYSSIVYVSSDRAYWQEDFVSLYIGLYESFLLDNHAT